MLKSILSHVWSVNNMGTRELPDTKVKPMDENHLAELIREAMVAFNDFIRIRTLPAETVNVSRPDASGHLYRSESFTRPSFRHAHFDYQADHMDIPAAKALMDYLWNHGGHRMTLGRDDDTDPDRSSWAIYAFYIIVPVSLNSLWEEHSIRSLFTTGSWTPFEVPMEAITQLAKDIASIEVGNSAKIKITIPLLNLTLADQKSVELEPGVTLHHWTQEDKAVYTHRNSHIYASFDLIAPSMSKCYLEIIADRLQDFEQGRNAAILEKYVGSIVGRVKWAVMLATDIMQLICELPATTETQLSMTGFFPVHRQVMQFPTGAYTILDESGCQSAAKLLGMLTSAVKVYPDLLDVVWMFDRATLAVLPRDVLLESAIGLERLLVHGNGENTRRFKVYGAALIGGAPIETAKRLAEIYSLRSSAAHGSDEKPEKFEKLSATARADLAMALANVVRLVVSSKIIPGGKENNINKSIERYLTSLMYDASQNNLNIAEKPLITNGCSMYRSV